MKEAVATDFFKIQRRTIEKLNAENRKLHDELEVIEREKKKSTMDAIKQMEEEVNKGLKKQREENGDLQQQLLSSHKENTLLKEIINQQQQKTKEEIERLTVENKKMKQYVDTLIRTKSDALKVVAMEGMLKDMIGQLSKMTGKCSGLQLELDKREKEAQRCHELIQRLEQQSKSYAATVKFLKTKMSNDGGLTAREIHHNPSLSGHKISEFTLPKTKIVKPIKGGAPAVKKHIVVPALQEVVDMNEEDNISSSARQSEVIDNLYEQNIMKSNIMTKTQEGNSIEFNKKERITDKSLAEDLGRKVFG